MSVVRHVGFPSSRPRRPSTVPYRPEATCAAAPRHARRPGRAARASSRARFVLRTGARSSRPGAHTRHESVEDARRGRSPYAPSARLSTTAFDLRRYTRRAFHGRRYWRSMIVDYSDAHERTVPGRVGRRPRRCEFERRTKTSRNDPISDCDTQRCKSGPAVRLRYATMAVTAHARTAHAVRAGIGARKSHKNNESSGDEASGRCWGRNVEQRI